MKSRQFQEMKQKSAPELNTMLKELREKLWTLRGDLESGKVKNVREIRDAKKDLARVMTVLGATQK